MDHCLAWVSKFQKFTPLVLPFVLLPFHSPTPMTLAEEFWAMARPWLYATCRHNHPCHAGFLARMKSVDEMD
jgi:hypothetical protein